MKNLFFVLAFMLMGTFAFANNTKDVTTVNYDEAVELIKSLDSSSTSFSVNESESIVVDDSNVLGCILTITFVFEDGSTTTVTVIVRGVSCEELLE